MLLRNRLFARQEASRSAKSFYIFCEGKRREYDYFRYFREMDSRVNIEIYRLTGNENNSPMGLFDIACQCILKSEENPNPKYEMIEGDEVWFVIDIDSHNNEHRLYQINELKENYKKFKDWSIVLSNPCFEVWLCYHFMSEYPIFEGIEISRNWKRHLDDVVVKGGFNSQKHPIFIEIAINNSVKNYLEEDGNPQIGCTSVFNLSKSIYSLLKDKIREGLNKVNTLSNTE